MSNQKELILSSLNENGKLDCKEAFKISAKTKTPVLDIGNLAKDLGIRIDGCELGQFGHLKGTGEHTEEAVLRLTPLLDEKNRVTCKDARNAASGLGLKNIRGTLKTMDWDVTYCELGCFKEKKRPRLYIKTKTWIENHKGELLFGKGKTEILEMIDQTGSIAKTSEKIGMNYKKAWNHVQILQNNIKDTLVETQKGGTGGTTLTPEAHRLIEAYKQLEKDIENYANERFKELFLKPRNKKEYKD